MRVSQSSLYQQPDDAALALTKDPFPITLLGIAQICSWGTLYYSFAQLAEAMIADYGWLKSDVYWAMTICLLFSSIAAIPVGKLIDKGKGKWVMTAGAVFAAGILLLLSQTQSITALYLLFAAMGIVHAMTLYEAAFSVIAHYFEHETAKARIIVLTLWGGFASTVFIPLIEYIMATFGWRDTLIILACVNLFICAPIHGLLPQNTLKLNRTVKRQSTHNIGWALKQPVFWALLMCFALFASATTAFSFHLYPLLLESGLSIQHVMLLMATIGPSQVVGRVVLKLIGKRATSFGLGIITTTAVPVVFIALYLLPGNVWLLLPFIMLFGIANGIMTIVKGTAIPEFLTKEAYGAINGAMDAPIKLLKAASPTVAAFIWMRYSDYDSVLLWLVALSALSAISFVMIKRLSRASIE